MKRLIIGTTLALAMAVGLTVGPSIATPEQAPRAEAQVAPNAAWIFYGPWLCQAATGKYQYPRMVWGPDVSPPGYDASKARAWHDGNAVRVSPVHLNTQSRITAVIGCPHPRWPWATMNVNVSGVRVFRYSGEAHWMNVSDVK